MPAVSLSAFGGVGAQFFDANGSPLSGGNIYSYIAGTTTPLATYTSSSGLVPHTNPIVLDAAGRVPGGEIWVAATDRYKFVLKTSTGTLIATYDNVGGSLNSIPFVAMFTGDGATTAFTLPTAATNENTTSVYVNGVYQNKNTYSVLATTLTFSEAPPLTSVIEINFV